MRCPVCNVGKLKVAYFDRNALVPFCDGRVKDSDVVRKKACDWCAVSVVTVERIAGMLTPPNEERLNEVERSRAPKNKVWDSRG